MIASNENIGAVLFAVNDLRVKALPMPTSPGSNEVIVRIKAVGICGSDVHYWTHGSIGPYVVRKPMVIGHESAGIIVSVGPDVSHLSTGDHVALEPGVPCRKCSACKSGQYNLCPDIAFFATPPYDGSLCTYVNHAADFCHKLPPNVSLEEGAMCEPLSVGVYACQRAGIRPGSSVAVFGAGPIGLISMMTAKAFGAKRVIITDISQSRLDLALKLGARFAINVTGKTENEINDMIQELNGDMQVDSCIECCGYESALRPAIMATKCGGCVCLVGMAQPEMKLPVFDAAFREVDLRGIFRYRNTYQVCIDLISSAMIDVKPLITHRYKLNDIVEAFIFV